jgi:hypothetical protein
MEWILQVVDEIDDVISALRLCSLGVAAEFGKVPAGSLEIAAPYRQVIDPHGNPTPL